MAQVEEDSDEEDDNQDEEDAEDDEVRPVADHLGGDLELWLLWRFSESVVALFWPKLTLLVSTKSPSTSA